MRLARLAHAAVLRIWCSLRRRVLHPIPQQHFTAFQYLATLQRHRRQRRALISLGLRGIEHAWRAFRAVHGRSQDQVEFVDQPGSQKGAVDAISALKQQPLRRPT